MIGDEVVQVYLRDDQSAHPIPRHSLVGFKRVRLAPGASVRVIFEIQPKQLACVDETGRWLIEPGTFTVFISGGQPGETQGLSAQLKAVGKVIVLDE